MQYSASAALVAYTMLEPVELDLTAVRVRFGLSEELGTSWAHAAQEKDLERRRVAKQLLLATDCLVAARLRHGADVVRRYELCIALRPNWARAYFSLARYFDLLLSTRRLEHEKLQFRDASARQQQQQAQQPPSSRRAAKRGSLTTASAPSSSHTFADDDAAVADDAVAHEHARKAMEWYARGLEHSAKFAHTAVPRLLTLWFEFYALEVSTTEPPRDAPSPRTRRGGGSSAAVLPDEGSQSLRSLQTDALQIIKRAARRVPTSVWYGAIPQLVSRAGHPNQRIKDAVCELLSRVLAEHPHQALWSVMGLTQSSLQVGHASSVLFCVSF